MLTKKAISERRSARVFKPDTPISKEIIEELIDAARMAPTARNVQPWEFVIVTEKNNLKAIAAKAENGRFIADGSCCIGVFCKDTKYYLEDGCAATENILIRSHDLGLSSCWVAGDKKPYAEVVKELLAVPVEYRLVSLIALGYSDAEAKVPQKRPVKELLHWERY